MEVLSCKPIGYQKVISAEDQSFKYQLRYVCIVKLYGPFVVDTMGDIVEIKLVDPKEYKEYLKWGSIGDRIIERAVSLL